MVGLPVAAIATLAAMLLAGCAPPEKPEEVPSPDTFECTIEAERWLVRFTDQEARLLTPQGERINLYQIPTASGVRFTNGLIELRGRGTDLTLTRNNFARQLSGCKPVMIPKEPTGPVQRMFQLPPPTPLGK